MTERELSERLEIEFKNKYSKISYINYTFEVEIPVYFGTKRKLKEIMKDNETFPQVIERLTVKDNY